VVRSNENRIHLGLTLVHVLHFRENGKMQCDQQFHSFLVPDATIGDNSLQLSASVSAIPDLDWEDTASGSIGNR
jgi:hypothetical protein